MKEPQIRLRRATMEDADRLLEIKNDADVRMFSIVTTELILRENHLRWLETCLMNKDRLLLCIGLYDPRTNTYETIGDTRLDAGEDSVEVSIRILPQYRRQGAGTQAVKDVCEGAAVVFHGKRLVAKILPQNVASRKTFEKCGFRIDPYAPYQKEFILYERA